LLVDPVLDSLQSHFASNAEGVAFEDIFAPLDAILLDVGEQLLD